MLKLDFKWAPQVIFPANRDISDVKLHVNKEPVLYGKINSSKNKNLQVISLKPPHSSILLARASHNQEINLYDIPETGIIDLVATYSNGSSQRIPFSSYAIIAIDSLK